MSKGKGRDCRSDSMRFAPWTKDREASYYGGVGDKGTTPAVEPALVGGGGGGGNAAVTALIIGTALFAVFLILGFLYAFRGQQTGLEKTRVGELSAVNHVYGFEGLQNYSPSFVSASINGSPSPASF